MALILDHAFIITEPMAPEAKLLRNLGLVEGSSNTHPGQGTSNRRFFLDGFTIELLYISDYGEAENGTGRDLGILNRHRDSEASSFGIAVRESDQSNTPAFPSWQYYPDFFSHLEDKDMCFYIGDNSSQLLEPLCFCMPLKLPKKTTVPEAYANPKWTLTKLLIDIPITEPSNALEHFLAIDMIQARFERPHKMTMIFNHGTDGQVVNLMPELPLVLQW